MNVTFVCEHIGMSNPEKADTLPTVGVSVDADDEKNPFNIIRRIYRRGDFVGMYCTSRQRGEQFCIVG